MKDRPCAVVLTAKREGDKTIVAVAPITHTQPQDPKAAVEIPAATKERLRLDDARSWIVTNEINIFTWPGVDLRPVNSRDQAQGFAYGPLPEQLANSIIDDVKEQRRLGQLKMVRRDEPAPVRKDWGAKPQEKAGDVKPLPLPLRARDRGEKER